MGLARRKYQTPPRSGMEVYMLLPEGTLAELINDTIYMSPTPNYYHQSVSLKIASEINFYVQGNNLGECVTAPMDVFFDDRNALQPDILFISKENLSIVNKGKIKGSPDLIIEVLSPGNKKHDTERKKAIYEKFGIKEYFIVDPETKETITWYLIDGKFIKQQSTKIKSKLLKKTFTF
ncbi:MAG: Uma2 family endonuclease [Chitinophagaceae bacterium]|nr:Uma2 family endonuclease [Chitinophagaceae bacterium]